MFRARKKFSFFRPRKRFSFSDIRLDLSRTSFVYYAENLPLPYATRADRYKASPVPRLIHFIWIGSVIPEQYVRNISGFVKVNPDREIVLWVDCGCGPIEGVKIRTVDKERLVNREIYERTNNIGVKADLLRMEIILEHGGIYSDVDAVALRRFSTIFDSPFLAYEPHKWKDITNGIFGFPKNDLFLNGCVNNLKEHIRWVVSERRDLLSPTGDNVSCLCGGLYIMSQLFRWRNLDELAFISQDYLVTDTGCGFSMHTMDATWIESLQSVSSLL